MAAAGAMGGEEHAPAPGGYDPSSLRIAHWDLSHSHGAWRRSPPWPRPALGARSVAHFYAGLEPAFLRLGAVASAEGSAGRTAARLAEISGGITG
jgi:hypothetical protein